MGIYVKERMKEKLLKLMKLIKRTAKMSSRYKHTSSNKLLDKLTIEQLMALRTELVDELLLKGYTSKYLEDFDQDLTEKIIESVKNKFFRSVFNECQYKSKNGTICNELDCQKHILNKNGILVCKKSVKSKKVSEIEEETDSD
jgi:hypothetical protein